MTARFSGAITNLYDTLLIGWAWDRHNPDARLAVEVYIDGAFAAVTRADQWQQHAAEGDSFHGFSVQFPKPWIDQAKLITARIANQGPWLEGSLVLPTAEHPDRTMPARSQLHYNGGLKVTGWIWDPTDPARTIVVTAREGERLLARTLADRPHPGFSDQYQFAQGFALDLPWDLADGQAHEVHLESEDGDPVNGSPIMVCHRPEGIEALIRQYWPTHQQQQASFKVLIGLARDQDQRAPRTLGFAHYPHYFALWQPKTGFKITPPILKIGVLILEMADIPTDLAHTQTSIKRQTYPVPLGVKAPIQQSVQGVRMLLEQGADAVVLLESGDHLADHAVQALVWALRGNPQTGLVPAAWVYSDCDTDGSTGERTDPWLKPVWDPDLFMGADIFSCGALFSAAILRQALTVLENAAVPPPPISRHSLMAAIALATEHSQATVTHIPLVLYHRRAGQPNSPAQASSDPLREAAVAWMAHCQAPGSRMTPIAGFPSLYRIHWPLPESLPTVSLIIPTRDRLDLLRPCIQSLLEITDYPQMELIVVDNDSSCPETLAYLDSLSTQGIQVLKYPYPFNYSAMNNWAIHQARGCIIGLINNDIQVRSAGWLREMVSHLLRPGIGAVGAKLLWPNGMVQHGGVVVGINGLAAHTGNHWLAQDAGYLGINQLARRQSAVTAACLLVYKTLYQHLGGLDEQYLPITFNDVDLCLKIIQAGQAIIWTPFAELLHAESASRGKDHRPHDAARARREQEHFIRRWGAQASPDPYYHPALNHDWGSGPYGGLNSHSPRYAPRTPPASQNNDLSTLVL